MEKNKVVKNDSKGYGYNYASLSDIANQGFEIPKMKTGTEDGKEYVFYFDKELKEWMRGAEIVVPDGKGMNKAQLYGSALTYSRRYTTLMALQLACDDDKQVEELNAKGEKKQPLDGAKQSQEVSLGVADLCVEIEKLYTEDEIEKILAHYGAFSLSELKKEVLEKYYIGRKQNTKK